jgi:hypothetical protein
MRLAIFIPLYAGILLSISFMVPIWREVSGTAVPDTAIDAYPVCWQLVLPDFHGKPLPFGPIVLKRDKQKFPFDTAWYQAHDVHSNLVAWAPAQGDSFDIAFYHDPIVRFPRVRGPVRGRVYYQSYASLAYALLDHASYATGEQVECPRSGE